MAISSLTGPPAYGAITRLQALTPLDTVGLFAPTTAPIDPSPLDQFIANTELINVIYMPVPEPLPGELGTLVLLGYMSAVESSCRALLRGLINIDEYTRRIAEPMTVSFGAAIHHKQTLLPEALFEELSFAGSRNVESMIKELIGIKGQLPHEVQSVLTEFRKICELRHCCVHRFGKLGAKSAIMLGLARHAQILEHPFAPTKDDLQEIADLLRTFVKTVNNFVFLSVLNRTVDSRDRSGHPMQTISWYWNYRKDRRRFLSYYNLFAAITDSPPSPSAISVYDSFRGVQRTAAHRRSTRNA
jgi:hypothetical protein